MTVTQAACDICKARTLLVTTDESTRYYDRAPIRMLVVVGSAELAGRKHATFGPCHEKAPLYREREEPYEYFGHAIHRCGGGR